MTSFNKKTHCNLYVLAPVNIQVTVILFKRFVKLLDLFTFDGYMIE